MRGRITKQLAQASVGASMAILLLVLVSLGLRLKGEPFAPWVGWNFARIMLGCAALACFVPVWMLAEVLAGRQLPDNVRDAVAVDGFLTGARK